MKIARVLATPAAVEWIERLRASHGDLLFHQSGGCCDGSAPMCYPAKEFRVGSRDVQLGEIAGCPFYIGAAQHVCWAHTQLIIDVVPGRGAGFSLEAPEGVRFLTRSRVFSEEETLRLASDHLPSDGGDTLLSALKAVQTPSGETCDRPLADGHKPF